MVRQWWKFEENGQNRVKMIDTVILGKWVVINSSDTELGEMGWIKMQHSKNGLRRKFICNGAKNSHAPRLTLIQNLKYEWYLKAEVSIPAWLFRTNTKLPDQKDILTFLEKLSDYISEKGQVPFDAFSAKVSRVDFTKDLPIGRENIFPTMRTLFDVKIPKFRRIFYEDQTVEFRNKGERKGKSIKVYDKLIEMIEHEKEIPNYEEIKDLLRLEIAYRSPHFIETLRTKYKLPDTFAKTLLKIDIAEFETFKAIELLNLDKGVPDKSNVLERLVEKIGLKRSMTLFAFTEVIKVYGFDFYELPFLEYSERTYKDTFKEVMAVIGFCI
jgi:hypothetical protein